MPGSRSIADFGIAVLFLLPSVRAQTPVITQAIADPAGSTRFAAGSRVSIQGSGFGPERVECCDGAEPGLEVSVNNVPAAIDKSSPTGIVVRFPARLPLGPATLRVTYQGRSAQRSVEISPFAPAIVSNRFLVILGNGQVSSSQSQDFVTPGQVIMVSASGLGPTIPEIPTASDVPFNPPVPTAAAPTLWIGSQNIPVLAAKLTAGPASGLYSVFFRVPQDLSTGVHRLFLGAGGFQSNPMYLPVSLPGIQLAQTGLTFRGRAGGEESPPKRFHILNATDSMVQIQVTPSTLSGGAQWLKIEPPTLSIKPWQISAPVFVTTNPTGLAAGDYYGQISVQGDLSLVPQVLSVVLNVLSAIITPEVDPAGLVFSASEGGQNPAADSFFITNQNPVPLNFTVTSTLATLSISPLTGAIPRGGRQRISVGARLNTLPAGIARGTINVQFPSGIPSAAVSVLTLVTPRASPVTAARTADINCVPKQMLPTSTALVPNFQVAAAWPVPLEAQVISDCGDPMVSGSVTASFSNGESPIALAHIGDGNWSGTWTPRSAAASNRITITAERSEPSLKGSTEIKGSIDANPQVPIIQPGGVVSAASFSPILRNAPGEMISIFGSQLAPSLVSAPSLPLPTTLLTASATLGGFRIPLIFASPGQINGLLPYEVRSGGNYQLIMRNGNRISTPESMYIADAGPAVFSTDGTGAGQGHIYAVSGSGSVLAGTASPARPGSTIIIYCSGLGLVDQKLANGAAVPASPLSRVAAPVSLEIGGVNAEVLFAGLTPGLVGLYQINAIVPESAPSGDTVPVLITSGEVTSPAVTMSIRR